METIRITRGMRAKTLAEWLVNHGVAVNRVDEAWHCRGFIDLMRSIEDDDESPIFWVYVQVETGVVFNHVCAQVAFAWSDKLRKEDAKKIAAEFPRKWWPKRGHGHMLLVDIEEAITFAKSMYDKINDPRLLAQLKWPSITHKSTAATPSPRPAHKRRKPKASPSPMRS